jgi:vanillate/4-hydroxybenzoate decarboxylase subunit D
MPYTFPRSEEPYLYVSREPADGECPKCGQSDLKRYPVLSEGGWWDVVKCQQCLHSVSRARGPRLGSIEILSDTL